MATWLMPVDQKEFQPCLFLNVWTVLIYIRTSFVVQIYTLYHEGFHSSQFRLASRLFLYVFVFFFSIFVDCYNLHQNLSECLNILFYEYIQTCLNFMPHPVRLIKLPKKVVQDIFCIILFLCSSTSVNTYITIFLVFLAHISVFQEQNLFLLT